MLHFALVAGAPAAVRSLADRLPAALDATRLFDQEQVFHVAPSGCWAIAARSVTDPLCAHRVIVQGDSVAVFNGPALSTSAPQVEQAADLLARFESSGATSAVAAGVTGSYNFVGVNPTHGLRAFGDFTGLHPLYWAEAPGAVVVTNRSVAISELLATPGFDPQVLAWLIGHANIFGDHLPARSARYLPPGLEGAAPWGEGRFSIDRSPSWIWPDREAPTRPDLTPREWDDITEELVSQFRTVAGMTGELVLRLSGGKDSRLALALAKAAGLEQTMSTITTGKDQSPEVEVAKEVADAAGFVHRRPRPLDADDDEPAVPVFDADEVWGRLRESLYRYESTVCPWDGMNDSLNGTIIAVTGFGGELYRGPGGHAKKFKKRLPDTIDGMITMFVDYHQKHDPLRVLQPSVSTFQDEWLAGWVRAASEEIRLDQLPEKFFVDYRLGHWNGPLGQGKPGLINVNPLLSPVVARKIGELDPEARGSERFHFEVMMRAAPELLSVPLLDDSWSAAVQKASPIELPKERTRRAVVSTTRLMKTWQWPFLEGETAAIEEVLIEAKHETDFASICDVGKLRKAVRQAETFNVNHKGKALVSGLAVAMTLLGQGRQVIDRPDKFRARQKRAAAAAPPPGG